MTMPPAPHMRKPTPARAGLAVVAAVLLALLSPGTVVSPALASPAHTITDVEAEQQVLVPAARPDAETSPLPDPSADDDRADSDATRQAGMVRTPAFASQPQSQSLVVGSPLRISFTYNGTAVLSEIVRLQRWVAGTGWTTVAGLQVQRGVHVHAFDRGAAGAADAGRYRLEAVQSNAQATLIGHSIEFTITVDPYPRIVTQPTSVPVTEGRPASFSIAYSTGSLPTTVRWQRAPSGSSTFADVAGWTGASITVSSTTLAMSGDRFRAVITASPSSGLPIELESAAATLIVNPVVVEPPPAQVEIPEFVDQPRDITVTEGRSAQFSARVDLPEDLGDVQVLAMWQRRPPGSSTWFTMTPWTATTATGHTSFTYPVTRASDDGSHFRVTVRLSTGLDPVRTSSEAMLRVLSPPGITGQPVCDPVDEGTASTCTVTLSPGSQVEEVRWETLPPGGSWQTVATGTSTTYTTPPTTMAMDGTRYRVVATGPGGSVTSAEAPLVVRMLPPVVTQHPSDLEVDAGQDAVFTAAYAGTTGAVRTQWYAAAPGGLASLPVPGATETVLTITAAGPDLDGTRFHARFSNAATGDSPVETRQATLVVHTAPTVTLDPESTTVVVGQPLELTAAAAGSRDGWTQRWQSSTDGVSWVDVPGADQTTYRLEATPAELDGTHFQMVFGNRLAQDVVTSAAVVTVVTPPQARLEVTPRTVLVEGPL